MLKILDVHEQARRKKLFFFLTFNDFNVVHQSIFLHDLNKFLFDVVVQVTLHSSFE